jgi:hypothetical protein
MLIAILVFSLLSAILQIVGCAGPWIAFSLPLPYGFGKATVEYALLYISIGGLKVSRSNNGSDILGTLGITSVALLSVAIILSSVVLVFAGVLLQKGLERARSPYAGYLTVPGVTAPIGTCTSLPRALTGVAWTAMVFGAAGLGVGISSYLGAALFDNITPGVTFVGRDCTIAAAVSSLISAILASIAGDCCLCCCSKRADGVGSLTSAPSDSAVDVRNPLPPGKNEWIAETDGSQTWYLNKATGETSWTIPAGGRLV